MSDSSLALASFGVTAYELAARGVPSIHLCLTEDHASSASAFMEQGMAVSLGVYDQVSVPVLANAAELMIGDEPGRARMSDTCLRNMDGKGAARVAMMIARRIASGN
jgi:spore coat polysaccharide biosynthesis protein SpsF